MSQVPEDFSGTFTGRARRPAQYAFFHNEGTGYLHSQYLGKGVQGTATLVRCCRTGLPVVRKRTMFTDFSMNPFADQFILRHPNIVQLLAAQNYFNAEGQGASATYWQFANGKDLKSVVLTYRTAGERVPEILIWHFLSQIFRAYVALFSNHIIHQDGHWGNVLVHWNPTEALPDFILGDLGMCGFMPADVTTVRGSLDEPCGNDYIFRVPPEHLDLLQGPPTLQQLYNHDEEEVILESYEHAEALIDIGQDMERMSHCMTSMMHDEEDLANLYYSDELRSAAVLISNLDSFITSCSIRTFERLEMLLTQLRCLIEAGFAACFESTTFPDPGLESIRPEPLGGTPMLFESVEALHTYGYRPPGPWHIVAVDPDTYEVLSRDSMVYCLDDAVCTGSDGAELMMEADTVPDYTMYT